MNFNSLQLRILSALLRHRQDKITEEQLAARLCVPYGTFRYELYRLRRITKNRTTEKLIIWWEESKG